jgi:hypothetical protein
MAVGTLVGSSGGLDLRRCWAAVLVCWSARSVLVCWSARSVLVCWSARNVRACWSTGLVWLAARAWVGGRPCCARHGLGGPRRWSFGFGAFGWRRLRCRLLSASTFWARWRPIVGERPAKGDRNTVCVAATQSNAFAGTREVEAHQPCLGVLGRHQQNTRSNFCATNPATERLDHLPKLPAYQDERTDRGSFLRSGGVRRCAE